MHRLARRGAVDEGSDLRSRLEEAENEHPARRRSLEEIDLGIVLVSRIRYRPCDQTFDIPACSGRGLILCTVASDPFLKSVALVLRQGPTAHREESIDSSLSAIKDRFYFCYRGD